MSPAGCLILAWDREPPVQSANSRILLRFTEAGTGGCGEVDTVARLIARKPAPPVRAVDLRCVPNAPAIDTEGVGPGRLRTALRHRYGHHTRCIDHDPIAERCEEPDREMTINADRSAGNVLVLGRRDRPEANGHSRR